MQKGGEQGSLTAHTPQMWGGGDEMHSPKRSLAVPSKEQISGVMQLWHRKSRYNVPLLA